MMIRSPIRNKLLKNAQRRHGQYQYQGHSVRKRFGQHFLVDQGVIDAMMATISPQPKDHFVEIGPGLGALTKPLLNAVNLVDAIEIDHDLVAQLRKRFGRDQRLTVYAQDVLTFDISALALRYSHSALPALRLVGNLPYHLSSALLFHLISAAPVVIDQHFMLQREVIDRMIAAPGSQAYGRLSVMLQYHYTIDKCLDVAPTSFLPWPKVNSAVVRMVPHKFNTLPLSNDIDYMRFSALVRAAFSQRRKMLRNALADYCSQTDFDLNAIHFDLTRRAEEISVNEYVTLAQCLSTRACA